MKTTRAIEPVNKDKIFKLTKLLDYKIDRKYEKIKQSFH